MQELLLHPPLVHFAIVLPVIALFFQIAYSVTSNQTYSKCSVSALAVAAVVMVAAWYTGGLQGQDVYPMLSDAGQESLKAHKNLGLYLMAGAIVLSLIKFYAYRIKSVALETLILIGLLVMTSGLMYQGLIGGDVVYKYGGGVENYSDGMDCLEEQDTSDEDDGE